MEPIHTPNSSNTTFLRLPDVLVRTGLSRSELYRRMAVGAFPASVKIGQRAGAWSSREVDTWISATIAKRHGDGHEAR